MGPDRADARIDRCRRIAVETRPDDQLDRAVEAIAGYIRVGGQVKGVGTVAGIGYLVG